MFSLSAYYEGNGTFHMVKPQNEGVLDVIPGETNGMRAAESLRASQAWMPASHRVFPALVNQQTTGCIQRNNY
jgi:hypothetical protein